jgi:hypothetical protein
METSIPSDRGGSMSNSAPTRPKVGTLNVIVRYAAARKPFEDLSADRDEQLSGLKTRVLNAFELTEGEDAGGGNTFAYKLYHDKTELKDLSQSLGEIAGSAGALSLKLSQFVQQG